MNDPEHSENFVCLHCRKTVTAERLGNFPRSNDWESRNGCPSPLGVSWVVRRQAYNFALFSQHAEKVELLFFTEESLTDAVYLHVFDRRRNRSGSVWHCRIPLITVAGARYYAYRIASLSSDTDSQFAAIDEEKLLLDPYAKSVFFPEPFDRNRALHVGSNVGVAPLALLNDCHCCLESGERNGNRHGSDLIIYEMHARGFTRHPSSGVAPETRGTFSGIVKKIPYLKSLGVTAIELMPVFQFDPQDGNYWGYMPLNFFAVHHDYSVTPDVCAQRSEFRTMVKELHAAGIEVIVDVVFNHTCEGGDHGPTYSFKGIDNESYYILTGKSDEPYANFSGTGNTLNTSHAAVRQLVLDSLRYWVAEMDVDGFRFYRACE